MAIASRICSRSSAAVDRSQQDSQGIHRLGQPRPAQRENGRLASGHVSGLEESRHEREVFPAGRSVRRPEKHSERTSGSLSPIRILRRSSKPAALVPKHARACAAAIRTSFSGSVSESTSRGSRPSHRPLPARPWRQPAAARRSPPLRPNRLELHVTGGLLKDLRRLMLQLVQRLDHGDLGPAELVILDRARRGSDRRLLPGRAANST